MTASNVLESGSDGQPAVIDEEHLVRMTLGDRGLEREVLQIFVRQSATILDRITEQLARAKEWVQTIREQLGVENPMAAPKLLKIIVNMGVGEATQNAKLIDPAATEIGRFSWRRLRPRGQGPFSCWYPHRTI